jgi:hypothetical protein
MRRRAIALVELLVAVAVLVAIMGMSGLLLRSIWLVPRSQRVLQADDLLWDMLARLRADVGAAQRLSLREPNAGPSALEIETPARRLRYLRQGKAIVRLDLRRAGGDPRRRTWRLPNARVSWDVRGHGREQRLVVRTHVLHVAARGGKRAKLARCHVLFPGVPGGGGAP